MKNHPDNATSRRRATRALWGGMALTLLPVLFARTVHAHSVRVGDHAPAFRLAARSGDIVTLDALRGQPVVVDFWASWCVTCRTALPALDALVARRPAGSIRLLAVNVDRDRAAAEAWLARRPLSPQTTVLFDPEGNLLSRFGAEGLPALYVIDGDGVVRDVESGPSLAHLDAVERALDALMPPAR
jgi:cytochrome c biogenesis protein CcmG/thiol:disulfide interchange protein DsbE